MDFSSEKKRRVGHVYGIVLYNIPIILQPPWILLGTDNTMGTVLQALAVAVALLQGGVNVTERLLPPYKLQLTVVNIHPIKLKFSVHHRNIHICRKLESSLQRAACCFSRASCNYYIRIAIFYDGYFTVCMW